MLLLIDAGNTNIKWAVPANEQLVLPPLWLHQGAMAHDTLETLQQALQHLIITRVLVSHVAGATSRHALATMLQLLAPQATVEWFSASAECAGLKNAYIQPAQLGSDRFAAAIAARALFPEQALIVATCGTATTIDAISADGVFTGGMILPGLQLMAQSLAKNTAQLPQVSHTSQAVTMQSPFADNTEQAIINGCINAQIGAIERSVRALQMVCGSTGFQPPSQPPSQLYSQLSFQPTFVQANQADDLPAVRCLIAGGAALYLLPHIGFAHTPVENLVLTGLLVVAQSASS